MPELTGKYRGLKPFVKGDPRRINKPKGAVSISTEIKKILNAKLSANDLDGIKKKMTIHRLLSLAAVKKAMEGDTRSLEIILERTEGKVPSDINLGGQADNPVNVISLQWEK